jgi:hypothetical protein
MEKNMTRKITAILAAAVVLGSFGVASAGTNNHRSNGQWQARQQAPYSDVWTGSGFPAGRYDHRDPLAGSVFDGIAPY